MAEKYKKDDDLKRIKQIIEIMKDNELAEVEIKHGDDKILLKRCGPQSQAVTAVPILPQNFSDAAANTTTHASAADQTKAQSQQSDLVEIKSSIVGTFYSAASPDAEPLIEVGSEVVPQTIICIIEAMKVMNEIKAETSGTIAQICVENGQAVEYGQVLFKVKPD